MIEIMAPAGSFESLMAAVQAGADSVYFGAGRLNMRSRSSVNFTKNDFQKISNVCKPANIKTYLTLNTVIYDTEKIEVKEIILAARSSGIDAVIASDISVIQTALSCDMPVHISTQCNISNYDAVKFYSSFADVMVMARELSLDKIADIVKRIDAENICGPSGNKVRVEVFVHGALCMAVSGKCYLSLDNYNYSANRGACFQMCRRGYTVTDKDTGMELDVDNEYIMSPKDLCTIGFLDKMLNAGVSVLKIEGRGRSADYVKTVTSCYKEAVLSWQNGTYSDEKIECWQQRLSKVFNRGFWDGYYLGKTTGEWNDRYGSRASRKKTYCAKVTNYFTKLSVAEIKIESESLCVGDEILLIGSTTGVVETKIEEIRIDDNKTLTAVKGSVCSIPFENTVRRGDKIYRLDKAE